MARPSGVRNADYDEKRQRLLDKLTSHVLENDVDRPSLRQFSIVAETSEPTLKHYFDDRTGLIIAIFENFNRLSEPLKAAFRGPFDSITDAVNIYSARAARMSSDKGYTYGNLFMMRECLSDPSIFKEYVKHITEPAIEALAEGFVRSKGGPRNLTHARTAAKMIVTNAMGLTFQKHILGDDDKEPLDFAGQFNLMANWMLKGLENDPDGSSAKRKEEEKV